MTEHKKRSAFSGESFTAGPGIEPGPSEPESPVLPLDDPALKFFYEKF